MNQLLKQTLATLLLAGLVGGANAGHDDRGEHRHRSPQAFGKVIQVKPIYDRVRVATPQRRCWKERDYERHSGGRDQALAGAVIGGIVGGIAGNQFGDGDGRTVMTLAGGVLGAVVGHQIGADLAGDHRAPRETRRCESVEHADSREELVGYRVKYVYNGRVYATQTDRHPGERIPVDKRLRPIHF